MLTQRRTSLPESASSLLKTAGWGWTAGRLARLPASCAISVRKRRKSWIYLSERANQKQEPKGRVYRIQSDGCGFDICSTSPRWSRDSVAERPNKDSKVFLLGWPYFLSRACLDEAKVWRRSHNKRVCGLSNSTKKECIFDKLSLIHTPTVAVWITLDFNWLSEH